MHVLLTANTAWNIHNFRAPVVRALLARGDRVTALAPPDASVAALEAAGVRLVPLRMRQDALGAVDNLAVLAQIDRRLGELKPDVILSYTIKNNLFGALAARRRGIPFLPNVSGLGTAFLSGGGLRRVAETLYRLAFSALPVVFFQNAEDRALFIDRRLVRPGAARLLPGSGIDLQRFAPAPMPDGPPTFLMIARLLRDKGVMEYLEAAASMRQRHPQARFRLLGGLAAGNRSAIDPAVLERGLAESGVEHLGEADDVRPHIARASCVVLPSYREGAPRTLIEAAAMARPVIATDVPGCREVVENGRTGLLCAARSAASLAQACGVLIAMGPGEQARLGEQGRARMVAAYDEKLVVQAYLAAIAAYTAGRLGG